jgi:arginine utilization protein RocB
VNPPSARSILDIFYPYVAVNSESGTVRENLAAAFFRAHFERSPRFAGGPGIYGTHPVPADPAGRTVEWAMVRGRGRRTAVLMHHFDVVEIEDYGPLGPLAFDPERLEAALWENPESLDEESRADLESGGFIFGRGAADMKAGGAVQMALLDEAARDPDFPGNLLLIALPDEENLSAGMRAAVDLLADLKDRYDLDYVLMINSEPHQRKNADTGVLSGGSIGKILPFVYVRGILAHAGKSAEGYNPLGVLSRIVRGTEMSTDLADSLEPDPEMSPPPTWLMARDSKESYDVSMPLSAFGILSVQPLANRPDRVLPSLLRVCETAAAEASEAAERSSRLFRSRTGRAVEGGPAWTGERKPRVLSFGRLVRDLRSKDGAFLETTLRGASERVRRGEPLFRAVWTLVDALAGGLHGGRPLVVTGFLPPYYPSVSHRDRPDFDAAIRSLAARLSDRARGLWGQEYELESYFTGISDLSYSSILDAEGIETLIRAEMPLYGDAYSIPFGRIAGISMPCVNIGPWGKDFHKRTERVSRQDLTERTPVLLTEALRRVLDPAATGST